MPKTSKRVACQTLARPCQKMNGGLTRDCAGLSYNSYKISCGNPEATLRSKIGTQILIFAKSFQSGRVPEFGTNVPKNERSVTSRSQIGAEILILAKTFQRDLAPKNGAFAPKNERGVTSGLD